MIYIITIGVLALIIMACFAYRAKSRELENFDARPEDNTSSQASGNPAPRPTDARNIPGAQSHRVPAQGTVGPEAEDPRPSKSPSKEEKKFAKFKEAEKLPKDETEDEGDLPTISPLTLSAFGLIAMTFLWLIGIKLTTTQFDAKLVTLAGGILVVTLWFLCWKSEPEKKDDKKGDKDKKDDKPASEVPDGHVAILEILGIPIKWFTLSEGRLWLIPFVMDVKIRDIREENIKIPLTPEEAGFTISSSDGIALRVHVSATVKVDGNKLYRAIFGIKAGSAIQSFKDEYVTAIRELALLFPVADLINAGHESRKMLLDGFFMIENGKEIPYHGIIYRLYVRARAMALTVIDNSISIVKIDFESQAMRDYMSQNAQRKMEASANETRAAAVNARAQEIRNLSEGNMSYGDALSAAQQEFNIVTKRVIAFEGKPPSGVLINIDDKPDQGQNPKQDNQPEKEKKKDGKDKKKDQK